MNIKDLKAGTYTAVTPEEIKKPVAKMPVASSTVPVAPVAPKLNINSLPPSAVKPVEEPGLGQRIAQGVASPFLKTASSVRDIAKTGTDLIKTIPSATKDVVDLVRATPEQRSTFLQSVKDIKPTPAIEYDYGYFGKKKAVGSTFDVMKGPSAPENVEAMKDAVGTAAEIGSYFPAGKAVTTVGKGILARTLPKIKSLATEGAASGALQGFGTAQQENKGIVDTAIDTGISTVAGGVLAPVVGLPLGAAGNAVTRQIAKVVNPEKEYKTAVLGNINKALGTLKKGGTLGSIPRTNEKKIEAFELMHDLAPNLKYTKNGEEAIFDPKNVSPEDMAFALPKAKEYIYNIINKAKQEATGKGVQVNLVKALDMVNDIADNASLGTSRGNAEKLSDDLVRIMDQDGNATIEQANQFAKDLNTRLAGLFNGTSDNLSREQEAMVSKEITDAIDNSMGTIFDTRFKKLQGQYSALKTIEEDVLRQYRKEIRQLEGVPQFIKDYGNAEILSGIMNAATTGNPSGLVKGLVIKIAGNKLNELRKPSTYLRKVFKEIENFRNKRPVGTTDSPFPTAKKKVVNAGNQQAYGAFAGVQQDEEGNVSFDPKAAVAGVAVGSLAKNFPKKEVVEGAKKMLPKIYKEAGDLTTKILKSLEGKATVSKQYILDATNRGELKQQERDVIRQVLETESGKDISVADFAEKVKAELLPLKVVNPAKFEIERGVYADGGRYENIALPDDVRGNVKNYKENIYESPIKTSAGSIHFGGRMGRKGSEGGYFGHTRIEDMADNQTRRVIEVQSDLYQKGNLEKELPQIGEVAMYKGKEYTLDRGGTRGWYVLKSKTEKVEGEPKLIEARIESVEFPKLQADKNKLAQYSNPTAHFRMVREELKKAAVDGKTKLQFPTGETAMKVEGLGDAQKWSIMPESGIRMGNDSLTKENMKVGQTIYPTVEAGDNWIVTDVLGDGKFKAIPQEKMEDRAVQLNKKNDAEFARWMNDSDMNETFDISGKIDTNNPIYRFYEKDLGRYLTSKYGAKIVTDDKGVQWYEIPVKKEWAKMPVEAFGIAGITTLGAVASSEKASAAINKDPEEVKKISASLDSVYKEAEKIAPMINKDYIKTLVQRESSNGTNDEHRDADEGRYGWIVGFTKPTYKDIVNKAKTSQKYRNLLALMPGFDTPDNAIKSALIYSNFLLRDHTKEQTTGKREYKKINAAELYKLYNGNGSPQGVKAFEKEFGTLATSFPKKKYD